MDLTSLQFLLFSALIVVAINASTNKTYRAVVFLGANTAFIASHVTTLLQLGGLTALLVSGYLSVLAARRWPNWWTVAVSVPIIIALFVYLKRYTFMEFLPALPFAYLTLGLSYILFRIIHIVVDVADGGHKQSVGLLDYFNYTCGFLTFISGPIQRFQDFLKDKTAQSCPNETDAYDGFWRVAVGYFKVLVISAIANAVFVRFNWPVLDPGWNYSAIAYIMRYAVAAALYTIFLYYNFSGYTDIVIGFGILMGLKLPENFDRPFSAGSFLEFWNRWHMTLSHWFRTYMYNPLLKALMERAPAPSLMPLFGVFSLFATFLVIGVWHGATSVFLVYGLALGACAGLNKLYQLWISKRLGRARYRELCKQPLYSYSCRGLTFACFAMALTAFWVDFAQLGRIVASLGPLGAIGALLVLTIGGAAALFAADISLASLRTIVPVFGGFTRSPAGRDIALASVMLATIAGHALFSKAPEFVYRAF